MDPYTNSRKTKVGCTVKVYPAKKDELSCLTLHPISLLYLSYPFPEIHLCQSGSDL